MRESTTIPSFRFSEKFEFLFRHRDCFVFEGRGVIVLGHTVKCKRMFPIASIVLVCSLLTFYLFRFHPFHPCLELDHNRHEMWSDEDKTNTTEYSSIDSIPNVLTMNMKLLLFLQRIPSEEITLSCTKILFIQKCIDT